MADGNGNASSVELALVKAELNSLKGDIATLAGDVRKLAENGQWSLQKLAPLSIVGSIMGFVLILFIQNQTSPISQKLEGMLVSIDALRSQVGTFGAWQQNVNGLLQTNAGDDERSKSDRSEQGRRLDKLAEQVSKLEVDVTANVAAIAKVETENRADALIASQRESNTEQWKGMFYNWTTGRTLPQRGPVVPGIARDPGRNGG